MKPISRWQRNDDFRPDSDPSRGDPCRPAFRPIEASRPWSVASALHRLPAGRNAQIAVIAGDMLSCMSVEG